MSLRVAETLTKVREALASRYLFDNWLSLLIRYALIKIGFNVKLTAKVNGCTFESSPEVFGCLTIRASRKLVKLSCINGKLYINGGSYGEYHGAWVYDGSCNCYVRNNVRFKRMPWTIYEIFDCGEYEPLNVKDRVVVDVGAYVGDSAIYFALKGAMKVVAVEPHPANFAEMLENIKLNNLGGVIVPINAGLASKPDEIYIENVGAVPVVTLSELISRLGFDPSNAVLKIDCEGCEFDVILNDYEHVRLFKELILEYHPRFVNKSLDDLLNVLDRDFKCDIRGDRDLGIMYCVRK
jgi:methyltransferase, FkbM family